VHINPLEGRAVALALLWRARKVGNLNKKFLHLLDSQVNIGTLTKRRSSSRVMHNVVQKSAATELAAGFSPVYGFTRSEKNPADRPSRYFKAGRRPLPAEEPDG